MYVSNDQNLLKNFQKIFPSQYVYQVPEAARIVGLNFDRKIRPFQQPLNHAILG